MDGIERIFGSLRVATSGLAAERARIDVIAQNIANARTTSMPGGSGPYRRQVVSFEPILERAERGTVRVSGVRVSGIAGDATTPFERIHEPGHPHADADGFVTYPNVNVTQEMADLITAVRAYEANLSVQEGFLQMAQRALRLAE